MRTRLVVIGAVVLILVVIYLGFFHKWFRARIVSVSPDGMYKYELVERGDNYSTTVTFALHQRKSDSDWELLETGQLRSDSIVPSNWSIDWQYDDNNRRRPVRRLRQSPLRGDGPLQ